VKSARPTSIHREDGWVMVPVIALLAIAIGLSLALLAIVDVQTSQGRQQRDVDAAQALAEGAAAAASSVLGSDPSASAWAVAGACRSYTHKLTDNPTGSGLEARIAREVHDRFSGTSSDLVDVDSRTTSWTVSLCPIPSVASGDGTWSQVDETRWSDAYLSRTVAAPSGIAPRQLALWVRAQGNVRSAATATGQQPTKSRAVAVKTKQASTTFSPPTGFAMGTGSISTDVGSSLSSTLLSNSSLTGTLLGKTLGSKPLIGNAPAKIGTRCGLLNALNQISSTCLSGTLSGAGGATSALALGQLNTVLGVGNQATLGTWTMASQDAIDGYRQDAIRNGIYVSGPVTGYGDDRTKNASNPSGSCLTSTQQSAMASTKVVYIEQVGDGDQYCTLNGGTASIFVVARGAVRVTGTFRGILYALNQQECATTDCSDADRGAAIRREVIRIEGNSGNVTGAVWVDGAGGQVGIYPKLGSPDSGSLLQVGSATDGICGVPVLGPVLNGLSSTLGGIVGLVGDLLGGLLGSQEQVRYVDANGNVVSAPPSNCEFMRGVLGSMTSSQLLDLFGTGGTRSGVYTQHRTRSCVLLICGSWSSWSTRDTVSFTLSSILQTGTQFASVVSDVVGLLTATLTNYQAITYDESLASNGSTQIRQGAGPVPGTFRSVATRGGF
jgi:hypothetical protein